LSTKARYEALLNELCAGMGWCGSVVDGAQQQVDRLIPAKGDVTATQFADWLFEAEGANPALVPKAQRRAVMAAFVRHLGSDVVDAGDLRRA
jgi:hypothetical protein